MPGMMRRAYQTDLSDAEWALIEPIFPPRELPGARGCIPCARSSTLSSSTWCVAAAPGACSRTTSRRGRASTTTTSEPGASTGQLGAAARGTAQEGAGVPWEEPPAQRWHYRQPEREDHQGGRRRARLRPGQEGEGKKAPPLGGHAGAGAKSEGPRGERLRPRRDKAAYGARRGPVPTPFTSVARCRLQRQG